ncbi:hypothetical protein RND71_022208 [Anisodus tanguticus]|uniref:Uncharacterized protein n=1 Tax=Anisodus tanguticus TaxID=243964 RepID=A0AAE1VFZ4_9SOLA|nr:hypothetical protein RND71_022208 [Anisodus tanguticus]
MDALDVLGIILLIFVFVGVFMFIIELCTNCRAKEIRATRLVVAASSVHVNVYGGNRNNQTAAARAGGGAAQGGGGAKDVTIDIHDGISGKVPSFCRSTGDGSTAVPDGSKGCAKDVTIVLMA